MRWLAPPPVDEMGDPRAMMGYVSGWMYVGGALVGVGGLALPSLRFHPAWQLGLSLAVGIYGLLTVADVQHWARQPIGVHIAAMVAALPILGVCLWATGGARSYLIPVLVLAPIHWAFFLDRPRVVFALSLGLAACVWAPIVYAPASMRGIPAATTVMWTLTLLITAGAVVAMRRRLRSAESRLRSLTDVDPLTGLLNRRGFDQVLAGVLARSRPGARAALVVLDLDHLKLLNDAYGHAAGDRALRLLAERLRSALRPTDQAARLGGDEFAFVSSVPAAAAAERIARRLTEAVAAELPGVVGARVAATVGWAVGPDHVADPAAEATRLFEAADRRLLNGKRLRPPVAPWDMPALASRG